MGECPKELGVDLDLNWPPPPAGCAGHAALDDASVARTVSPQEYSPRRALILSLGTNGSEVSLEALGLHGCEGPQPLAGKQVARLLLRDRDLNACFSRDHVFTKCLSSFALTASTPPKHAPLKLPEHSLRHIRSSMCSGGRGTIQLRADPKDTQTTALGLHHVIDATRGRPPRPFRNVDAPPAAVRPPPSPPCSVYQSLSIVPVGALTPPGSHGAPASGLPAPRRRAHRAPSGRRRAPGSLPGRGGGGWRRGGPPAVRRARVPMTSTLR